MGITLPADGSVPPDFVIAQQAKLKDIREIASALGLKDDEFDMYGKTKAKVRRRARDRSQAGTPSRGAVVACWTERELGRRLPLDPPKFERKLSRRQYSCMF
jgi:Formate--tetrahydrofolate ligase